MSSHCLKSCPSLNRRVNIKSCLLCDKVVAKSAKPEMMKGLNSGRMDMSLDKAPVAISSIPLSKWMMYLARIETSLGIGTLGTTVGID